MNSWYVSDGIISKVENHPDTTEFYFTKSGYEKVLVFVPQPMVDSGKVEASKVHDVRNSTTTLSEYLATDVLYLIDSDEYPHSYIANLFTPYEGKPRSYFVIIEGE